MTADRWVIAAQGEEEPAACEQDLSRSEARQEAKEALKEEEEAQQLQQVLAALGKRVMPWRAQGCEVGAEEEEGDASAQDLNTQQADGPKTVLVEVPAGADAALYLVETGDEEGNYWVSLKESTEDGEVLTHIEVGLEGEAEVQGLSSGADTGTVSFLLPNESVTQEIVGQVQQLLEGSTESAGLRGMSAEELDWSRAEVLLLDGDVAEGEEVEALLVIPAVDDGTGSQALWGRTRAAIDPQRATYARVRVQRLTPGSGGGSTRYKVTPQTVRKKPVRDLRPAFRYCPYRYYGRLVPFDRELCREAWARWYEKQWEQGKVYKNALQIYNTAITIGAGAVSYLQDNILGTKLLVEGFEGLDLASARDLLNYAAETPQFLPDPAFVQAFEELKQFDIAMLID